MCVLFMFLGIYFLKTIYQYLNNRKNTFSSHSNSLPPHTCLKGKKILIFNIKMRRIKNQILELISQNLDRASMKKELKSLKTFVEFIEKGVIQRMRGIKNC